MHKHHPKLVLFRILSSIARLRKVIQFPSDFGCGKSEIGIAMRQWLIIQAGAFLINVMFCNGKMRWEVGRNKVISGYKVGGILLNNDK